MLADFLDAFSFPLEKLSVAESRFVGARSERRMPPPPHPPPPSTGQDSEMPPVDALDGLEGSRVLHDALQAPRDAAPELPASRTPRTLTFCKHPRWLARCLRAPRGWAPRDDAGASWRARHLESAGSGGSVAMTLMMKRCTPTARVGIGGAT